MADDPFKALRAFADNAFEWGLSMERVAELADLIAAAERLFNARASSPLPVPPPPPPRVPDDGPELAAAALLSPPELPPFAEAPPAEADAAEEYDEFEEGSGLRVAQLERSLLAFGRDLRIEQRVLLAEGDSAAQAELIETLAQGEILADVASTAEEALERLKERDYAVLVADARLPDADGVELISQARKLRPDLEVVVCTSSDALDEALRALDQGASDYLAKPYPSRPFISWKIRAALGRYAFAARTQSVIRFLKDSCEQLAVGKGQDLIASCIVPLKKALASYQETPGPTRVSVLGPKALLRAAENLGYETVHAKDLAELIEQVKAGEVQVVVAVEEGDSLDAVEVITRVHRLDPEVGLFVVAPERKLQDLVQAIGSGIGDYLLRPLEGRELFAPRLRSLIARRERWVRYNRLLTEFKVLNIDLQKALARPE